MASGSRSKQQVRLDLEVPFLKTIAPDKLGKLIVEIVKYILYEREQLPTPYDEFKRSTKQLTSDCNSANKTKPAHPIRTIKQRRALASIDAMDLIFTSTQQLIQSNKLSQVLLVFGPTVMSPVESYVIRVPERDFACRTCGDTSAFRRCMLQVLETFRAVGQTDGGTATTKLTTFLCLRRRDVEFALMDVRPSFQVPRKGRLTVLNLSLPFCRHNDAGSVDATCSIGAVGSIGAAGSVGTACSVSATSSTDATSSVDAIGDTSIPSCDDPVELAETLRKRRGDARDSRGEDQDWVWAQCKPVFTTVLASTFPADAPTCL
ncbi:MAD2L1-binding protein [Ixodes scapularis]